MAVFGTASISKSTGQAISRLALSQKYVLESAHRSIKLVLPPLTKTALARPLRFLNSLLNTIMVLTLIQVGVKVLQMDIEERATKDMDRMRKLEMVRYTV